MTNSALCIPLSVRGILSQLKVMFEGHVCSKPALFVGGTFLTDQMCSRAVFTPLQLFTEL